MSRPDSAIDEYTLLCERCGYIIEGLPETVTCPECGKPITQSLRRTRAIGVIGPAAPASIGFALRVLRRPIAEFDSLRIHRAASLRMLRANVLVAGLLTLLVPAAIFALSLPGLLIPGRSSFPATDALDHFTLLVLAPVATIAVLHLLTAVEMHGIRFFGRRRGWRITPDVALAVCALASTAWRWAVLGSALVFLVCLWQLPRVPMRSSLILDVLRPSALAFLPGMLIFESLVYIGMRRCRFANRPR